MRCDAARLSLGVYLADALEADERSAVDAHLGSCPACAGELAELDALPGLLGLLTLEEVEAGSAAASEEGFERLLARAEAQPLPTHRSRLASGRLRLVSAAAAVLLVGAAFGLTRPGPATPASHHLTATAGSVQMTVTLTSQVRGTAVDLAVRGVPANQRCRLVAVTRDGSRQTVGAWQATYSGQAWSKTAMPIPRDQLAELLLVGDDGRTLVRLPV